MKHAADDPKTSEFAFFKKLKENAGHKYQSHTLHKEENKSKNFKISDCSGGKCSDMHLNCNLGLFVFFFFVLPVLKAGMNLFLFLENFMYMNQPYLKYLKAMHLSGHDYLLAFSVLCRKPKQCQI